MQSDTPKLGKQDTIVLASHNNGKIKEFKTLLSKYNLNIVTAADIGIKDIEETGKHSKKIQKLKPKMFQINILLFLMIRVCASHVSVINLEYFLLGMQKIQVAGLWLWKIYTKK